MKKTVYVSRDKTGILKSYLFLWSRKPKENKGHFHSAVPCSSMSKENPAYRLFNVPSGKCRKFTIQALAVFVISMLVCQSCTTVKYYPPKGGYIEITTGFFDKKISKVTFLEDGSFEIEGYQSDLTSMIKLSQELSKRIPAAIVP